ncbi:hypothetical protein BST61_g4379 [Cercospora zeina]
MAIYQAFMSLLVGAYHYNSGHLGTAQFAGSHYSTEVFSTSLIESIELSKLALWQPSAANISNATSGSAYHDAASLYAPAQTKPESRKSLDEMLEELFFDVTISMASSEALLYNHSSPYAPPPQNVTFRVHGNIYTYDAQKLWIPYGIALGVSLLNVICGLWAMLSVGASFTADFSSVARIARNARIDADLKEDLAGKDPLPSYMARATLDLHGDEKLSIGKPELVETVREFRPDRSWAKSPPKTSTSNSRQPKAMGGSGSGGGTNPEELFAAGYGACFQSAMNAVAPTMGVKFPSDSVVDTTVHLIGSLKELDLGIRVEMKVKVKKGSGVGKEEVEKLVEKTKGVCPYSRATEGNVVTSVEIVME